VSFNRVLMSLLTMLVRGRRVLFGLFVLALTVLVRCLKVVPNHRIAVGDRPRKLLKDELRRRRESASVTSNRSRPRLPHWVNLRHERLIPTGPLNPDLPPLQTHPQAAAVRHKRSLRQHEEDSNEKSEAVGAP
jgi:hypothetical protein